MLRAASSVLMGEMELLEPEAEDARESAIADATQSLMVEILNLWEAQLAQEPLAPCLACRGQHRKHTCRL